MLFKNGQKVWGSILSEIKSQISVSTFKAWFSGSFVLDYQELEDKNLLIVGIKNNFLKEHIETRYLPIISQIKNKKGLGNLEVVFVVAQNNINNNLKNGPLFTGEPQRLNAFTRKAEALNPNYSFANFVVGHSNNLGFAAATHVAASLGRSYNPLFIYGPTGVGKTHLLHAIGNEVVDKTIDAKVLYVSAERFTNDFIESLSNKTQQLFRQKYRNLDVLLVDDVQFLSGKESTQDEFFHCFNELALANRQIVLTSDNHPKDLGRLKERLASRFLGGMVVDISYPDLEMKIAIVRAKCRDRKVELDDKLVLFIAEKSHGGARELEGVLTATLAHIKISNGKLTVDEIKNLVSRNKIKERPAISPGRITSAVCKHFNFEEALIRGSSRKASLVRARQVLMYLLRHELELSLGAIGEIVGGRDHSTVIHSVGKVDQLILQDPSFRDEILRVKSVIHN